MAEGPCMKIMRSYLFITSCLFFVADSLSMEQAAEYNTTAPSSNTFLQKISKFATNSVESLTMQTTTILDSLKTIETKKAVLWIGALALLALTSYELGHSTGFEQGYTEGVHHGLHTGLDEGIEFSFRQVYCNTLFAQQELLAFEKIHYNCESLDHICQLALPN